jgi:transposase-like protein
MEIEATDFIGRSSDQRRQDDQGIYRNGYKRRRVATGEGSIALHVPQTRENVGRKGYFLERNDPSIASRLKLEGFFGG